MKREDGSFIVTAVTRGDRRGMRVAAFALAAFAFAFMFMFADGAWAGEDAWIPVGPPPPGFANFDFAAGQDWAVPPDETAENPEAEAQQAYAFEQEKYFSEAMRRYWNVERHWAGSDAANVSLQRLSHCLFGQGDFARAAMVIEQVLVEYPDTANKPTLHHIELNIADHLLHNVARPLLAEAPSAEAMARRVETRNLALRQADWIYQRLYTRGDDVSAQVAQGAGFGLGVCQLFLGNFDEARSVLFSLAEEFHDTPVALRAARIYAVTLSAVEQARDGQPLAPETLAALVSGVLADQTPMVEGKSAWE